LHRCENKGLAERAIRIFVKTKDNEIDMVPAGSNWFANRARRESLEVADSKWERPGDIPYPRHFAEKVPPKGWRAGRKLLKINDGGYEKSAKRVKESANV
jgi:hypothetical protein